ncbi:hypothetical protein [Spirosoma sp.]|uniref:DUF6934 family protein n=1 Tax=Spirosoma sp. TaxID=1899569 RepID=UPI00261EE30C|nr:hypothetical protein [Spirosoma sp.]MCX6213174.1 hypothetical protein [Spirosoma sp.]
MNEPAYTLQISSDVLSFTFDSVSSQNVIHKAIEFSPFPANAIFYNLALLDVDEDGTTNDLAISNNQDMNRVIATVFKAMRAFFEKHPNKLVYFKGSDETGIRTRLYRALISRELEQASEMFAIYGQLTEDTYEEFAPNRPYIAFIFQLKHSR